MLFVCIKLITLWYSPSCLQILPLRNCWFNRDHTKNMWLRPLQFLVPNPKSVSISHLRCMVSYLKWHFRGNGFPLCVGSSELSILVPIRPQQECLSVPSLAQPQEAWKLEGIFNSKAFILAEKIINLKQTLSGEKNTHTNTQNLFPYFFLKLCFTFCCLLCTFSFSLLSAFF